MPRVRYTDDAGRYHVAGKTFEPGGEADVSEGLASHLVDDVGRFERVGSDDMDLASHEDDEENEYPIEVAPDVDEWHDWNEDDWLDIGYEQRADDVHEGRVDDHLDDVEAVETSQTVTDAVQDRRAELEEA